MPTTLCAPLNIVALIPELKTLARTAVRLHPRPGDCSVHESHMGNPFLWPVDEAWPHCDIHQCDHVPVLQLLQNDLPDVNFPGDYDVLQLTWCPHDHNRQGHPEVKLLWRCLSDMAETCKGLSMNESGSDELIPSPCCLAPEPVVEYPDFSTLAEDLQQRILHHAAIVRFAHANAQELALQDGTEWQGASEVERLYRNALSIAPGSKWGGYPQGIASQSIPTCHCGREKTYLLTIASAEFNAANWQRWLPAAEQDICQVNAQRRADIQSAADVLLGEAGNLHCFICSHCADTPVTTLLQS